jgi:adenylate kinase
MKRNNVIGITGSPGTGKKSVGKILADKLNFHYLDLNKLAFEGGAILRGDPDDYEVEPARLQMIVKNEIKDGAIVICGHLVPHILAANEVDFIAILRCSPEELEKRYALRKYHWSKIKENISAELIDISFYDTIRSFGEEVSAEFNTTKRKAEDVATDVYLTYKGLKKKTLGEINWLSSPSTDDLVEKYLI